MSLLHLVVRSAPDGRASVVIENGRISVSAEPLAESDAVVTCGDQHYIRLLHPQPAHAPDPAVPVKTSGDPSALTRLLGCLT